MKSLTYPAKFVSEPEGGFSVHFIDLPEAHTQGDTRDEAFRMAIDCLHAAIEWRLEDKTEIPAPSRVKRGQIGVPVALDLAPKLALYQAMKERKVSNVKLASELHTSEMTVRRMLDPNHHSKPDQYVRALMALGCTAQVSIVDWNRR